MARPQPLDLRERAVTATTAARAGSRSLDQGRRGLGYQIGIRIVGANLAVSVDNTRSQLATNAAVHHVATADPGKQGTKCLLHQTP
jgi:hypothetical protein